MCCCVFFNETATTEIYTYVHTLSLHDALPILAPGWMATESIARPFASIALSQARRAGARAAPIVIDTVSGPAAVLPSSVKPASAALDQLIASSGRSEEHTSELQSLMRISYAVFCLKKKNINTTYLAEKE